jgi:phosphatidylglycerophosphate synthase
MTPEISGGPRELGLMHRLYKPTIFSALARVIPSSVHPNVITAAGQLCAILAAIAAYWAAHGMSALYLVSALLHFVYLASDNVDGMHARRTQQVSLTGELLDHGLDGLAILCLSLSVGFVLHVDGPFLATFASMPALAFLLAHWEHEQTKYFGPVTGQADGYTLGVVLCVLAFAFDNPPWLAFSFTRVNAALLLVALLLPASLVAVVGPGLRAWKRGAAFGQVLVSAAFIAALHVYALWGAPAWLVAATVGIFGTHVGVRAIRARVLARASRLLSAYDALVFAPGAVKLAIAPSVSVAWVAIMAAAIAAVGLIASFGRALSELRALDIAGRDSARRVTMQEPLTQ